MEHVVIVEFPEDMVKEIEAIIAETGETFSEFVNRAIGAALDDLEDG